MRISIFGRHQRHGFAEIVERVSVEYEHLASPDEYPTATYPRFVAQQLAERGEQFAGDADPEPTLGLTRFALMAGPETDGGRPVHELDYALVMGGAR